MDAVSQADVVMSSDPTDLWVGQPTDIPLINLSIVTSGSNQEPRISQSAVSTAAEPSVKLLNFEATVINEKWFKEIKGSLIVGEVTYVLIIRKEAALPQYIAYYEGYRKTYRSTPITDGEYDVVIFEFEEPIRIRIVMRVHREDAFNNPTTLTATAVVSVSGNQPNNATVSGTSALSLCSSKSPVLVNIDLQFTIMGTDIGDTMCVVRGTKQYFPRFQFPRELIGVTQGAMAQYDPGVSNFSFQPDYVQVMKGCGSTAWQRAKSARECDPKAYKVAGQSDVEFYRNVCAFMVFRYYLAGLSSGKFNVRWLLRENTKEFYENLLNSDFKAFIEVFATYGFSKYERYMKRELC